MIYRAVTGPYTKLHASVDAMPDIGLRALDGIGQWHILRQKRGDRSRQRASRPVRILGSDPRQTELMDLIAIDEHIDDLGALFAALAEDDYAPKTVGYLESAVGTAKPIDKLVDELIFLTGANFIQPAQDEALAAEAASACKALNDILCQRGDIAVLASPMLGAGVRLGPIKRLFVLARALGQESPSDWAAFASKYLDASKKTIVKKRKKIEGAEEGLTELTRQANLFAAETLPVLKALRVAQ